MGGCRSGSSSLSFKTLFVTVKVLGFILVMLVGTLQIEGNQTKTTLKTHDDQSSSSSVGTLQSEGNQTKTTLKTHDDQSSSSSSTVKLQQEKQVKVRSGKSSMVHPQLDLNYMSKRRVPNGPDPIHNRRAGNSKRPPGQN
ncbi:hypothetical protein REPUB_Repub04eG0166000 [Reevesia pubescens]